MADESAAGRDGTGYRWTEGTRVVPPHPATIDLHTHTSLSDGLLAPERLLAEADTAGVRLLAITDHDTLAGYRALPDVATDVIVVPGVEINAIADGVPSLWEGELHILGLGVDPDDEAFEAALALQRRRRIERFLRIVTRLRELGLSIDERVAELEPSEGAALGRPTLARYLVQAGHAETVDEAMRRILARGKPGYERRVGMGPREAIRAIRAAGGLAVLAHFAEAPARRSLLAEMRELGLRGLEVYYRRFSVEVVEALAVVARDLGLVATGGSDYHGDEETYAEAHGELWVPPSVAEPLHAALRRAASLS